MSSLLVVGGCGFVGSNLCLYFKKQYPDWEVTAFDNLKRSGSELNIPRLKQQGIRFVHGDIRNKEDFDALPASDFIIEAAAEPSVLAGLNGSADYLINTNLNGTINCLNYAVKHNSKLIFLSTSRVYPFRKLDEAAYTETPTRFQLLPNQTAPGISDLGVSTNFGLSGTRSLYGATKLASELMITEYEEFLGLNAIINRCGVITGPWQMGKIDQGVIVLWMARHFWKGKLTYNGYGGLGKQVRDILHIHDLFRLLDMQLADFNKCKGKILNIGGGLECSVSLNELTDYCQQLTGNHIAIASDTTNRKADVRIYITDNTDVTNFLGWQPNYRPQAILSEIYEWIKNNEKELKNILNN